MIVNLQESNIYTIGNLIKNSSGSLSIQGEVNSAGDITVSGGNNTITTQEAEVSYSMSCKGTVTINNGQSNGDIYYKTALNLGSSWDSNLYQIIQFNSLPGIQPASDLIGYLEYLQSLSTTGTSSFASPVYTLKGYRTKSVNVYELSQANLANTTAIKIGPYSSSTHLIKINSPSVQVVISGLIMTATDVKSAPKDIIFAVDSTSLSITNSTIFGTIYAPNADITINNSIIHGAIIAKNITFSGTGSSSVYNDTFGGYIESAVAPEIEVGPLSTVDNYSPLSISISSNDTIPAYYEIRYTLDGSIPTRDSILYTGEFELYVLGIVTVTAKIFGNGVEDGGIASQVYGFKCKTENPSLVRDTLTGKYSIAHQTGATVYYTIDGSTPSKFSEKYVQSEFEKIFEHEGTYHIRFFAIASTCDASDFVDDVIVVELPDIGTYPPYVIIYKNGSPIYTIIPTPNTSINNTLNTKKTYVFGRKPSGESADSSVIELLTDVDFTISDVYNMTLKMAPYAAGDIIEYSKNESSPVGNITFDGNYVNIRDLSSSRLRACSHVDWDEYSQQIDYTILFRTSDRINFDTTSYSNRSDEILDSLQSGSSYAIDIAWVGPGVVTDDFAVYQALINILATDMLDRIFNPTFGVSISSRLAEIHTLSSGEKIISDLKAEVEAQDSRIKINSELSYAYFDESIEALVVDLVWVNTLTKNSAALKYAYDLDTIK